MPGGRPPLYNNCMDLEAACELYFEKCEEKNIRPLITGLALDLGFVNRQSLYDYQENHEFSGIIKKARAMVEASYENMLGTGSPTGAIFALKNMGWRDKQEVKHEGGISLNVSSEDLDVV